MDCGERVLIGKVSQNRALRSDNQALIKGVGEGGILRKLSWIVFLVSILILN